MYCHPEERKPLTVSCPHFQGTRDKNLPAPCFFPAAGQKAVFALSVDIITHLSMMGSFLNSGTHTSLKVNNAEIDLAYLYLSLYTKIKSGV